jgi:hypothetical protein
VAEREQVSIFVRPRGGQGTHPGSWGLGRQAAGWPACGGAWAGSGGAGARGGGSGHRGAGVDGGASPHHLP